MLTFGKEMETHYSEVLFWSAVFGTIGWLIKLLAFKNHRNNKLQLVLVRGPIRGRHCVTKSSNEPQENDEEIFRKEPGENDERESRKKPQENEESF